MISWNRSVRGALAWLIVFAFVIGCDESAEDSRSGIVTVSVQRASAWVRNFNPLSPEVTPRWPTVAGIHEPLMVFNSVKSEYVPWLATDFTWGDGNLSLRFTLREGVRWSDGEAFDADDVVSTFELLRDHPAMDQHHVWQALQAVRRIEGHIVEFVFSRPFVPGFGDVAIQPIVPEHVWDDVEDPLAFANPDPVGTGPFTEVRVFRDDVYEIGRNPRYWQEGVPAVEALRFPAFEGNDTSNLGLIFDEVDWGGDFIPSIDRVYVERHPEHHHYWFPLTGGSVFLYVNTELPAFADARVRKALSLALDRTLIVDVAMFHYTRPADATALTDAYAAWRDSSTVEAGDWVDFDPVGANALLDEVGFARGPDGVRRGPDGGPLRFDVLCVRGWSDWERAVEIIAGNLRAVGVDATAKPLEFEEWYQRVSRGEFESSIGWSLEGASIYHFYRSLMSEDTVRPRGESSATNWHRYSSAAADSVLERLEVVSDTSDTRELSNHLQRIFVDEAPAIPLFPGPSWAVYSTHRIEGFPSIDDPYADPSPHKFARGEVLLVLTRLRPVDDD